MILPKWMHLLNRRRLKYFRMVRNGFYRAVCAVRQPSGGKRMPLEECRSVAILMNGKGIGDAVVLSGFVRALQDSGKRVFIIGSSRLQGLYGTLLRCDGFISQEKRSSLRDLSRQGTSIDVIVNLFDPDRDEYMNFKSLAAIAHSHYLTFNHTKGALGARDERFSDQGRHVTARFVRMLARLGVEIAPGSYSYDIRPFSEKASSAVDRIVRSCGGRPIIFFNTASSSKDRSFSKAFVEHFLRRFEEVSDRYALIVLNSHGEGLRERFPGALFDPCGSLEEAVCLLSRSSLVITPDTSFVHFANFFRKRALCIYNNRRLLSGADCNLFWAPNYPEGEQVLSPKGVAIPLSKRSFHGDDLQEMEPDALDQALVRHGVLPGQP